MNVKVHLPEGINTTAIAITGSKSETNRLLLLQALYPGITFSNGSVSDDSIVMQKAISGNEEVIDIHHAGTAMRFLTAYFAVQPGRVVTITGSSRMKERPIQILVEALRNLGATIEYLEKDGYPPIKIMGQKITGGSVTIKADVSSQYITALMLIAARLENGLTIILEGEITSRPYIEMTLALLNEAGISASMKGNTISILPMEQEINPKEIVVESDWSSASYFYSVIALAGKGSEVSLSAFKKNSLQGDNALVEIYSHLGVETVFANNTVTLKNSGTRYIEELNLKLDNTPDIAQTVAVTCFGIGIACNLTGLHTLKIKETDRLEALKTELEKLGATISVNHDSLHLEAHNLFSEKQKSINKNVLIETYNDHRMAMAFATLGIKFPVTVADAGVVSKSYPGFWKDMAAIGFEIKEL